MARLRARVTGASDGVQDSELGEVIDIIGKQILKMSKLEDEESNLQEEETDFQTIYDMTISDHYYLRGEQILIYNVMMLIT